MHLVINQPTDRTEQVTGACIDKLYNLSKSDTLDSTSYLRGSINAAGAYEDAVTFLNTMWGPDLIVTAGSYYIRFADPEVESVLKTALNKAEGEGITTQEAAVTDLGTTFQNNTDISTFYELKYFKGGDFTGCSNLEGVDVSGMTPIPRFNGCSKLAYFNGPNSEIGVLDVSENTTGWPSNALYNVNLLTKIILRAPIDIGASNTLNGFRASEWDIIPNPTSQYYTEPIALWFACNFGTVNGQPLLNNRKLKINGVLVTSVIVPQSVTSIGKVTFYGYIDLTSVTFHNNVVTIGAQAFRGTGITSLSIPSSVNAIDASAFMSCGNLASIVVDANNTVYDSRNNCNTLIETATNKVLVGSSNSTIPSGITGIADSAFQNNKGIASLTLPASITSVGRDAFNSCANLAIQDINLPNLVQLGAYSFTGTKVATVTSLGSTITSIPDRCFSGCTILSSVNIPNTVTAIGTEAFMSCSSLTSITIPSGVTSIGNRAFAGSGIVDMTILATTPPTLGLDSINASAHIYVPAGSVSAYQTAWSNLASRIQAIPNS